MPEKEFNCYKCKYRRTIPGDTHSSCNHPAVGDITQDGLLGLMMLISNPSDANIAIKKLGIQGNEHGVKKGWFNWPFNFDPIWLENCEGFKLKNNSATN